MRAKIVCVMGASSRMGQSQVRQLMLSGATPRAVSRHWQVIGDEFRNVQSIAADFGDVASMTAAFAGADAIFNTIPSLAGARSFEFARNLVAAAKAAGVTRIIHNTTMWAPDAPCGEAFYDAGLQLEDVIAGSGLDVTVFRPVLFMDNLLTLFQKPDIVERGLYRYCQKPGMLASWIAMDDLAKFMVAALERNDLIGRRIVIGGPEILPIEEVVAILAATLGRPVTYQYVEPYELFAGMHDVMQLGDQFPRDAYASAMASFYNFNNDSPLRPFVADMKNVLADIPVPLSSMREWAARQDWSMDAQGPVAVGSSTG
jgi:uncharacterized protein YbjT (DUF2867 family)